MKTNVLTLIITLVVGVILAGSLLAPVIDSTKTDLGTPITKTNTSLEITLDPIDGNYAIAYDATNNALTINDVDAGLPSAWTTLMVLDTGYMEFTQASDTLRFIHFGENSAVDSFSGDFEITLNAGEYSVSGTVNNVAKTVTGEYSEGYLMSPDNTGAYGITTGGASGLGNAFTDKTPKWIIAADTLALDEFLYYDGTLNTIGDDEISVNVSGSTLADGTTDIYTGQTVTVTVNGETPSTGYIRVIIPMEVEGHAASGAAYTLLGVIPIMVIVALFMVAVGAIAYRRAD